MWQRFLRLLAATINAYSFYSNPVRFIIGLLGIIIIPYLAYIFWGTIIILALMVMGVFFIYRAITSGTGGYHYPS